MSFLGIQMVLMMLMVLIRVFTKASTVKATQSLDSNDGREA